MCAILMNSGDTSGGHLDERLLLPISAIERNKLKMANLLGVASEDSWLSIFYGIDRSEV